MFRLIYILVALIITSFSLNVLSMEDIHYNYIPTDGTGTATYYYNKGTVSVSGVATSCTIITGPCSITAATIHVSCTIANSDAVKCQYAWVRLANPNGQTGVKGTTAAQATAIGACSGVGTINVGTAVCGTGLLATGGCTNCMQLQITCWNLTSGLVLSNDSSVTATYDCGS